MRRFFQKALICLLSAGMVVSFGGITAFAAEAEDSAIQTFALEPDDWTADGYQPYHAFSHGNLQINGANDNETIGIEVGDTVILTVIPFAHVQYVGCDVGTHCCEQYCGPDDCWVEGKGCTCAGKTSKAYRLRLADVSVTTDVDDVVSCEIDCDYSELEEAGDMADGYILLSGLNEGTVTVTVNAALYDWVDAETTFTIVVSAEETPANPDEEEPGPAEPGEEEPDPAEPDEEEPGPAEPGEEEPDPAEPDEEEPGPAEPGEEEPDPAEPDEEEPGPAEPGEEEPDPAEPDEEEPGPAEPDEEEPDNTNPDDADPGVVEPGPEEPDDSGSGTDNPESGNGETGLIKGDDGKWGYYVNGKVDTNYTGFASNSNGDWYVVNGYVNFDQNSVFKDTAGAIGDKGTWYYVTGSKVQHDFTGLANYKNANGWWYIVNGMVDFTHNGVDKNKNGWYYVTGGKVQFDFTGLANYKNSSGWWYIANGMVDFTHNGVDKNKNGWYYVTGGKVQFGYTGVANYKNANGWWYIKNGEVDFSVNTVAKNDNGWWYVKGGKVDFTFKGVASNQNGTWYISGGKVQLGYSGTVPYGGKTYTVKQGKVS